MWAGSSEAQASLWQEQEQEMVGESRTVDGAAIVAGGAAWPPGASPASGECPHRDARPRPRPRTLHTVVTPRLCCRTGNGLRRKPPDR
ncbi:hypothetical protein SHKM778_45380 [Streptomyces sp. KM77-8]|uniref:Uncharacterized protein n=1 Tax=Streptomyces haneummycinicus TaxID=3074435 RepID=A0AAT9HL26_9ACTN